MKEKCVTDTINIYAVYTVAVVKSFEAGIAWYEKFMGRPADDLPFPGMAQWRNMGAAGLQLWQDEARAGQSIMTIVVPDLATEKTRLSEAGMVLENEDSGALAL
jgi:hypothetical protein